MKKIYIIVTFTGTILSRMIRLYTKNNYSHVSISLDKKLDEMYSFGRLNPYNPFIGGMVHEGINIGTFKRFKNTTALIYEIKVSEEQYRNLKYNIKVIEKDKNKYTFNIPGLFATSLKLKIKKEYSFYCAEFVKYVLNISNIRTNLPTLVKPEDFIKIENSKLIYQGKLRDYKWGE